MVEALLLDTGTVHTCRNFEKIRQWAAEKRTIFENKEEIQAGKLVIVD